MSFRSHVTRALLGALASALALTPISASAAFQCSASISKVLTYKSGVVNVMHSGRNDYTVVCSLSAERLGVSVATCAMWAATLHNIKRSGGTATFYYDGTGSCSTIATYESAPVPTYIMMD